MSVITFRNNRGTLDVLSPQRLRNDLMLLANSDVSEVEAIDFQDTDNQALLPIISKLSLSRTEVSASQLTDFVSSQLDPYRVSVLFAMSRPHFLALVYLLYSGAIDSAKLSEIIDLEERSRTQVILDLLPEKGYSSNLVTEAFERATANLYFKPEERQQRQMNLGYFDINSSPATVQDFSVRAVPDSFFTVFYAYIVKLYGSSLDNSPAGMLGLWNNWVCSSVYCKNSSARDNFFSNGLYDRWNNNEKEKKSDALGLKQRFPTFSSFLSYWSDYPESEKNLSAQRLHRYILNSFLPIAAIKTFRSRELNKSREWNGFPTEYSARAVSKGTSYASGVGSYSYIPNYFLMAYWMYNNTDSVGSSSKTLDYWETFLTSSSAALRLTESGATSAAGSFSYVSDSRVASFMKRLFPVSSSDSERTDPAYMSGLLLNRRVNVQVSDPIQESFAELTLTSSSRARTSETVRSSMRRLSSFDLLARDNGTLISMGGPQALAYAVSALSLALSKANYSDNDLLSIDSYSSAASKLTALKASVVQNILDQNGDPIDQPNFNPDMSGENANELNRVFVSDVVGKFFDYLLDNTAASFVPVLSSDSMKTYRLLNFTKHTLINFDRYMDAAVAAPDYPQFVAMVLLIKAGLDRQTAENILRDGSISAQEINGII